MIRLLLHKYYDAVDCLVFKLLNLFIYHMTYDNIWNDINEKLPL